MYRLHYPQGLVMVNKNDKVVYDEVMERQRKVSESDSNQQSYGQLVESQLQARYVTNATIVLQLTT